MVKFREQKSCSCQQCRSGSKSYEKRASHRGFRHSQRRATRRYLANSETFPLWIVGDADDDGERIEQWLAVDAADWEAGPYGAGYWD